MCFNNNKRDKHLKFYSFPSGLSKEKQLLRKKWIQFICRKGLKPTSAHRVCLEHFPGGRKSYINNFPSVIPKLTPKQTPQKERPTIKARNWVYLEEKSKENVDPVLLDIKKKTVESSGGDEAEFVGESNRATTKALRK